MKLTSGLKFKAKIEGKDVVGTVAIENGTVYLCQNVCDGADAIDKLGHKFSWSVYGGSPEQLTNNHVSDFVIISEEEFDAYEPPLTDTVFGYSFKEDGDDLSFGCGSVRISKQDLRSFIKGMESYTKVVEQQKEIEKPFDKAMTKLVNERKEAVSKFDSQYESIEKDNEGFQSVMEIMRKMKLSPKDISMKQIYHWFKDFAEEKKPSKTVEA